MQNILAGATWLALFLINTVQAELTVTPYSDGTCNKPIENWAYSYNGGVDVPVLHNENFTTGTGVSSGANFSGHITYSDLDFDMGDKVDDKVLGFSVYWSIPQPDEQCRVIFMRPFAFERYGYVGTAPGNVILSVTNAGCYYTSLMSGTALQMTYCCGYDECMPYTVGDPALEMAGDASSANDGDGPRTDADGIIQERSNGPKQGLKNMPDDSEEHGNRLRTHRTGPLAGRAGSFASAAKNKKPEEDSEEKTCAKDDGECYRKAFKECTMTPSPYFKISGNQQKIGQTEHCNTPNKCSFQVSYTSTVTNQISTSEESTFTTSAGITVGVEAGVTWPVEAKVSTSMNFELSQATTEATGQSFTNSTAKAFTASLDLMGGSSGFLTFTGMYTCYTVSADCPNSYNTIEIQSCSPVVDSNGDADGDYTITYIN